MPLSDAFLLALGRVTANFAVLEMYMDFAISGLVGPEQAVGQVVAAELSFRNKCAMLGSLFQLRVDAARRSDGASCLAKMKSFLSAASLLEARRNQITHSAWLTGENDPPDQATRLKITAKAGRGLQHQAEDVDVATLNALADDLSSAAKQVIPLLLGCLENRAGMDP